MVDPRPPEETPDLVDRLARGDRTVFDLLLNRHGKRLVKMAEVQRRRYGLSEAEYGDDDAVIEALIALWRPAEAGKLSSLATREGDWKKIKAIVKRMVRRARDRLRRKRRGGSGVPRSGMRWSLEGTASDGPAPRALPRRSYFDELEEELPPLPSIERWVDDADEFRHFLDRLDGRHLRETLLLTWEGFTSQEIAERLGIADRTVRRKIVRIRQIAQECGFGS